MTGGGAVRLRRATAEDCGAIADAVRQLARDTGSDKVPAITGATLAAEAFGAGASGMGASGMGASGTGALLHLWVAEAAGDLVGILVGVTAFSTWRGGRGLYVCDLWVRADHRGARLGEGLLALAAAEMPALGLHYMKLETTAENTAVGRFYAALGFEASEGETVWTLEREGVARLANGP